MVWWPHTPHTYIKQREHVITLLKSSYQVSPVTVCTVFIEAMLIVAAFHIHISETSRTLPFWLWRKVERGYRGNWRGICRGRMEPWLRMCEPVLLGSLCRPLCPHLDCVYQSQGSAHSHSSPPNTFPFSQIEVRCQRQGTSTWSI